MIDEKGVLSGDVPNDQRPPLLLKNKLSDYLLWTDCHGNVCFLKFCFHIENKMDNYPDSV